MAAASRLLALPAELRNEIYEYALLEPSGPVHINDPKSAAQPGLLKTCRQIREEATPYYYDNVFVIATPFYAPDAAVTFFKHFAAYGDPSDQNYVLDFGNQLGSWNAFIALFRAVYNYEIPPVTYERATGHKKHIFAAFACEILEAARGQRSFWQILTDVDFYKQVHDLNWGADRIFE